MKPIEHEAMMRSQSPAFLRAIEIMKQEANLKILEAKVANDPRVKEA